MTHVIPIHVAMDSVLRVAELTNVIVILDTLEPSVTTVSNVKLCVVKTGWYEVGVRIIFLLNILYYIPFILILSKKSNTNPTNTKTEVKSYYAEE